jgi:hypothetical protein
VGQVAECKFLNNRLVDVVAFMENISVKDSLDKVLGDRAVRGGSGIAKVTHFAHYLAVKTGEISLAVLLLEHGGSVLTG